MINSRGFAIGVVALGSLGACATSSDGVEDDFAESNIDGGKTDMADPAVGMIWFQGGGFCTGTLIAPKLVLTAGHCAVASEPVEAFYTGHGKAIPSSSMGSTPVAADWVRHAVKAQKTYPTYAANSCPNPTLDLGMIELADPITNISPVAIAATKGTTLRARRVVSAVGFGTHTVDGADFLEEKRLGKESVVSSDPTTLLVKFKDGLADHGDSGGPAIASDHKIYGTTSCHNDGDFPAHQLEYYARVDQGLDWIQPIVAAGHL